MSVALRPTWPLVVTALVFPWLAQGPANAQAPGEARHLHVLLTADTLDRNIGKSVKVDLDNMKRLLESGFENHKDRLSIQVLEGNNFTVAKVMSYFKDLKIEPNDAVMFFCASHGGYQPGLGHILAMEFQPKLNSQNVLIRSDLRNTMLEKRPRLGIILTDACNSYPPGLEIRSEKNAPDWETMRCLFLVPRGLVDVNSVSEGESAFGEDKAGGYFTSSFTNTLKKPFKDLDLDADGFLHWHEALVFAQESAQHNYADFRKMVLRDTKMYGPDVSKLLTKQTNHTVRVFSLPPLQRFGVRVAGNKGDGAKIVLVHEYTPAAFAGFKTGDVIVKIGDTAIKSPADFDSAVAGAKGNVTVELRRINSALVESIRIDLAPWPAQSKDG